MDLVSILIALIVLGGLIYIVGILPIDATIKTIIKVVAVLVIAIYLLRLLAPALHIG